MRFDGLYINDFASVFVDLSGEVDEAETAAEALEHFGVLGGRAVDEDFVSFADTGFVFGNSDFFLESDEFVEAVFSDLGGDLLHFGGGGSGSGGVTERVCVIKLESLHTGEGAFEFFLAFTGEADDDIGG